MSAGVNKTVSWPSEHPTHCSLEAGMTVCSRMHRLHHTLLRVLCVVMQKLDRIGTPCKCASFHGSKGSCCTPTSMQNPRDRSLSHFVQTWSADGHCSTPTSVQRVHATNEEQWCMSSAVTDRHNHKHHTQLQVSAQQKGPVTLGQQSHVLIQPMVRGNGLE